MRRLVLVVVLALNGCGVETLQREWDRQLRDLESEPLHIVRWLPGPDAHGVSPEVAPLAILNRPLPDDGAGGFGRVGGDETVEAARGATLSVVGTEFLYDWTLTGSAPGASDYVRWSPPGLWPEELFHLSFELPGPDGEAQSGLFSTDRHPAPVFDFSPALTVEQFGGNAAQASALNGLFEPGVFPMWLVQVRGLRGPETLPTPGVSMDFGPARWDEEDGRRLLHERHGLAAGYRGVTVAEDGVVDHQQASLALLIWTRSGAHLLLLRDARIETRVHWASDGEIELDSTRLSGLVEARWLLRLAGIAPAWRDVIDHCAPDVDTDGNGVADAATLVISSQPRPLGPQQWSWEGLGPAG